MLLKQLFWFTNYKNVIFHFASFSRCCSPGVVFIMSHSAVTPRCVSPGRWSQCNESGVGGKRKRATFSPRVVPSMSQKMTYFLQSSALWQFATLLGPGKRTPPSPPKKSFFLSFPKETWHLVGSVFRGEPKWKIGTALVSPHFFSQHQAAFWDIDGATPTHSPKSGLECPHRWHNSLISPDIHQPT